MERFAISASTTSVLPRDRAATVSDNSP
jgi:hypothetical protein